MAPTESARQSGRSTRTSSTSLPMSSLLHVVSKLDRPLQADHSWGPSASQPNPDKVRDLAEGCGVHLQAAGHSWGGPAPARQWWRSCHQKGQEPCQEHPDQEESSLHLDSLLLLKHSGAGEARHHSVQRPWPSSRSGWSWTVPDRISKRERHKL